MRPPRSWTFLRSYAAGSSAPSFIGEKEQTVFLAQQTGNSLCGAIASVGKQFALLFPRKTKHK